MARSLRPIVIRFGALGDLILLTPLLHLLHRRYGRPCTLVTSGGWARPLLSDHPDVEAIIHLRSRRTPYPLAPGQWRLTRALRSISDGPVYVCDNLAVDKLRALLRLGRVASDRCLFCRDFPSAEDEHWIDMWLRFGQVTPTAVDGSAYPCRPGDLREAPLLAVNDADRADLGEWLRARGLADRPLTLLQPGNKRTLKRGRLGAVGDDKCWPVENWAAAARAILERLPDARVIVCGARAEAALVSSICRAAADDRVQAAGGDLPLRRLLALLERAAGMISIDTGPAHAGAALGCPLVVLYADAEVSRWRPRSPTGSAVITLTDGGPKPHRVGNITPSRVIAAWHELPLRFQRERAAS